MGVLRRSPKVHAVLQRLNRTRWRLEILRRSVRHGGMTIDVNPAHLENELEIVELKRLRRIGPLRNHVATVRGGDWDRSIPLDQRTSIVESTSRHLRDGVPWTETSAWDEVMSSVARGDRALGASAQEEVPAAFARFDRLAASISEHGYRSQAELATDQPWDEVMVAIDRRGRVVFVNGIHRLAVARALGVEFIPATVLTRHRDWVMFRSQLLRFVSDSRAGRAYQPITHPDLRSIESAHDEQRLELIVPALPQSPATVLDIGSNLGYFCVELAALGYACSGVENQETNAYFAAGLADAAGAEVIFHRGSIFAAELGQYDVVLALNIFHHFLKQRDTMEELSELLGRLETRQYVFQAHDHGEAPMQSAFWNPQPDEFAEWIAERADMRVDRFLGCASDGRRLYSIR